MMYSDECDDCTKMSECDICSDCDMCSYQYECPICAECVEEKSYDRAIHRRMKIEEQEQKADRNDPF